MKKNIAIVTGGDSSELVISLKSAEQVKENIDHGLYNPYICYIREDDWHVKHKDESGEEVRIPIKRENFSFELIGQTVAFDYAFIALHGPPGEDGQLQSYLDKLGIPYSTSGAESLKLSFDKFACKEVLEKEGILTARAVLIRKDQAYNAEEILERVGLPCFIKPNSGGSSFGVSRINEAADLPGAIRLALEEDDEVLVESFISGNELTCGVLKLPSEKFVFPVTEIISKNEFFDYEAKYTVINSGLCQSDGTDLLGYNAFPAHPRNTV